MPKRIGFYRPSHLSPERVRRSYESQESRLQDKRFYASAGWRKLRRLFLVENPLCADCRREGRITAAVHVHHKQERKTHPELALEWDNLEAACQPCHNRKRAQP